MQMLNCERSSNLSCHFVATLSKGGVVLKIFSTVAVFVAVFVVVGSAGVVSAEYTCESGKEPDCFGTADFSFINRNLPDQIGKYDTYGDYPEWLATAPQYYYQDRCGMENRTSESYAILNYSPLDAGFYFCPFLDISADRWVDYATEHAAEGYVLSEQPQVGSIAIMNIGPRGHAAVVEEVLDNGKIRVSQYDLVPGSYSESVIQPHGIQFLISSPKGGKGS